jgi:hypothetical protein
MFPTRANTYAIFPNINKTLVNTYVAIKTHPGFQTHINEIIHLNEFIMNSLEGMFVCSA